MEGKKQLGRVLVGLTEVKRRSNILRGGLGIGLDWTGLGFGVVVIIII